MVKKGVILFLSGLGYTDPKTFFNQILFIGNWFYSLCVLLMGKYDMPDLVTDPFP